jgi:hypothetical protein
MKKTINWDLLMNLTRIETNRDKRAATKRSKNVKSIAKENNPFKNERETALNGYGEKLTKPKGEEI